MKSKKEDFESPLCKEFWVEEFKKMRFGATRPSELEFLLFYLFYYANEDFDKSVLDLETNYSLSETKVNKFLLEIEKRYKKDKLTAEKVVQNLAISIFEEKANDKQRVTLGKDEITFIVSDSYKASIVRDELEKKNIPNQYVGNNKKQFKLNKADFIAFFMFYYDNIRFTITENIRNRQESDNEYVKLFEKSKTMPMIISEKLKDVDIVSVLSLILK